MVPKPLSFLFLRLTLSFAFSEVAPEEVAESLCAGGQGCPAPHGSNHNPVWGLFQMSPFKMLTKKKQKNLSGFPHLHLKRLDVLFLKCNILFIKRI